MQGTQREREILRQTIAGYLATRCQLRFDAQQIGRAIAIRGLIDFIPADDDIQQALVFCEGMGYVKKCHAEMGSTEYWQATSGGVLAAERNGWNV